MTTPRLRRFEDLDSAFFEEGLRAGRLLVQRCDACGASRFPARPVCAECHAFEWTAREVAGAGAIYSYTVHHHPAVDWLPSPYVVVLVELEPGVRMIGNLVGADPSRIADGRGAWLVGRAVRAAITCEDDMGLVNWRLDEAAP